MEKSETDYEIPPKQNPEIFLFVLSTHYEAKNQIREVISIC